MHGGGDSRGWGERLGGEEGERENYNRVVKLMKVYFMFFVYF